MTREERIKDEIQKRGKECEEKISSGIWKYVGLFFLLFLSTIFIANKTGVSDYIENKDDSSLRNALLFIPLVVVIALYEFHKNEMKKRECNPDDIATKIDAEIENENRIRFDQWAQEERIREERQAAEQREAFRLSETERVKREKIEEEQRKAREAEEAERAYLNSPEGRKVRAARELAEIERKNAEIRLAEQEAALEIAKALAKHEEESEARRIERLKNL